MAHSSQFLWKQTLPLPLTQSPPWIGLIHPPGNTRPFTRLIGVNLATRQESQDRHQSTVPEARRQVLPSAGIVLVDVQEIRTQRLD